MIDPAHLAFITQAVRVAESSTPAMTTRHGTLARKNTEPVESFFDNVADAAVVTAARQTLLGTERRMFRHRVRGMTEVMALDMSASTTPAAKHIDKLRALDRNGLVAEVQYQFSKQQCTVLVWG